jgi:hypothetical protein
MVVLTRDMDPDSTAAWDRQKEVRLPEFTQFLLDRHKTPLLSRPEEVLASERFIPEGPQEGISPPAGTVLPGSDGSFAPSGTRIGRVVVTEKPDHPMFLGLDLPEVAEAISQRKPLVTTAVPLYLAKAKSGERFYRVGHPMNRNYDVLLKEFNQATGFARDVDVDPVSQVQVASDNSKMRRYVSAQVLEAAKQGGYSITPTDNPFLSRYEAGPGGALGDWGDSGYLVRPTIVAAGGVNTGTPEPSSRMIRVGSDEWNSGRFSKAHTGIDLLSNQPAVRKAIAERQDLNPEGWTTISLLDEIARYTGAEPGFAGQAAGVESFMDPVNPGAFSIALGQAVPRGADGRQSRTQLDRLQQITQTLANNAHFVQESIPGVLRGIDPQAGFERLAPRKPEQTGPRTLRELWSRTSRQAEPRLSGSARTRDIRSRMDQQRAAVLAEAAGIPQSELSGTPLLDILAASGGDKALAASPSLAKLLPERNQGLYPPVEDYDEDALLEELGIKQRQPGWSDLVEIGSNEGAGNLGYRVLDRPGDADGPITGRQAALEPFVRLAQRLGNLSPGHAAQVAESAFAQATGTPIDDMAIARRVAQIVRPDLVTGREQVQGLGNSPAPWLAPEEGQWRGQRGDRYSAPRKPNYTPRLGKLASISPQGELQARRDLRGLIQADAENERAAYLQDLLSPSGSWAVYGPQRPRPGAAYS